MRLLLLAAILSACGAPSRGARAAGFRPSDRVELGPGPDAATAYADAHSLRLLNVPVFRADPSDERPRPAERDAPMVASGLLGGEALLHVEDSGTTRLMFRTQPVSSVSCRGYPEATYRIAAGKDGSSVVLRLVPRVIVKKVHRAGPCTLGCGPVPPPPAPLYFALPASRHVSVANVVYDAEFEDVTCDEPHVAQ